MRRLFPWKRGEPGAFATTSAEWTHWGMSQAEADRLVELVRLSLVRAGWTPTWLDGDFVIENDTHRHLISLDNLAAMVRVEAPEGWPSTADRFVRSIDQSHARILDGTDKITWLDARDRLRVMLHDDAYAPDARAQLASREVVPGLWTQLAYGFDDFVSLVLADALATWPVAADDVFELALQQTIEMDRPSVIPLAEDADLFIATGSMYTATHVLALDRLVDSPMPHGAWAFIPLRDELVFQVIGANQPRAALETIGEGARASYAGGPYPASLDGYWWHDGAITPIPFIDGELQIPDQLDRVLSSID